MLNLRSGLVLAAAALCLWALYSLLSSLREPGLLRSERAAVLKGCDALNEPTVRQACVPLLCQKALLDAKLAPWNANFSVQTHRASAADAQFELVTGTVNAALPSFACLVHGAQVPVRQLADDEQLQDFIDAADEAPADMSST